jgi:HlyD family secretion protein
LVLVVLGGIGAALAWKYWHAPPGDALQGYVDADYIKPGAVQMGLLTKVAVRRGDHVAAGDLLFTQDDVNDRASRDESAARLAEAQARLDNLVRGGRETEIAAAEADLADLKASAARMAKDRARAEALVKTGAASFQQVDQAEADSLSAEAKVRSAQARLDQLRSPSGRQMEIAAQRAVAAQDQAQLAEAEWRLSQRVVRAPTAALVADVYARPGETVAAGVPVVSLLAPENILVRFFVPERVLASVHPGDAVRVNCDSCPSGLTAKVSFIASQPEYTPPVIYSDETRDKMVYQIEAHPEGAGLLQLKPGQPVSVTLAGGRAANAAALGQ